MRAAAHLLTVVCALLVCAFQFPAQAAPAPWPVRGNMSEATNIIHFGDSTPPGYGEVAVSGDSIVNGDPHGYFQINSGYLSLSNAGGATVSTTAGGNYGVINPGTAMGGAGAGGCAPGQICATLTTNTGWVYNIVKDANTFDVGNQTEWNAIAVGKGVNNNTTNNAQSSAANLGGMKIEMRPSLNNPGIICAINNNQSSSNEAFYQQDYFSYGWLTVEARDLTQPTVCTEASDYPGVSPFAMTSNGIILRGFVFGVANATPQPGGLNVTTQNVITIFGGTHDVVLDHDLIQAASRSMSNVYSGRFINVPAVDVNGNPMIGNGSTKSFVAHSYDPEGHLIPTGIDTGGSTTGCGSTNLYNGYCVTGFSGVLVYLCSPGGTNCTLEGADNGTGNITGAGMVMGVGATNSTCSGATAGTSYICYDAGITGTYTGQMHFVFNTAPTSSQQIYISYMVNGSTLWNPKPLIADNSAIGCNVTVTNSTLLYGLWGTNITNCGVINISGDLISNFYGEAVQETWPSSTANNCSGTASPNACPQLILNDNVVTNDGSNPSDVGAPHADAIIINSVQANPLPNSDWYIQMNRNRFYLGQSRGTGLSFDIQPNFVNPGSFSSFQGTISGSVLTWISTNTTNGSGGVAAQTTALAVGQHLLIQGDPASLPTSTMITASLGNNQWQLAAMNGATVNLNITTPTNMFGVTASGHYYTGEIIGNFSDFTGSDADIGLSSTKNFKLWNNTIIGRNNSSNSGCSTNCDQAVGIQILAESYTANKQIMQYSSVDTRNNVAEMFSLGGAGPNYNNVAIGSGSNTYCAVFTGLGNGASDCPANGSGTGTSTWLPQSLTDIAIRFQPFAGGVLTPPSGYTWPVGAFGSPVPIDFGSMPSGGPATSGSAFGSSPVCAGGAC